jgi:hypothetical protein
MVNVVVADISGKPLQNFREFVKGASFHRCFHPVPFVMVRPVHPFKIVLDIKQPETKHPADEKDGELDQDICPDTDREACEQCNRQNPEIREVNAIAFLFALHPDWNSLIDEENKDGSKNKHDKGIPGQPVHQAFPFG